MEVPGEAVGLVVGAFAGLTGAVAKLYVDLRASNKAHADNIRERAEAAEARAAKGEETHRLLIEVLEREQQAAEKAAPPRFGRGTLPSNPRGGR